jgi:hypothetical protein
MQKANKNDVRKEIADLISRIKEQSDRIGTQREIPQKELDLILYRIEELHKKTIVWAYLNELSEINASVETESVVAVPVVVPPAAPEPVKTPEIPEIIATEKPVAQVPEPAPEPVVVKKPEPVVPAELAKPQASNLKDVRAFIGINEKIMYIRQVFHGDDAAYNAAIGQFNTMQSWDEAQAFLSVLAGEYKWAKYDEPVEIFTQTIKRRFS